MDPSLQTLAVCVVVLFAKMFLVANYQAYYRLSRSVFVNVEDAQTFGTGTAAAEDLPQVQRAAQVWRNDGENIPIFLVLGVVYVMVGAWPAGAFYYFWGFTLSRVAHSVTYLMGVQPWRTITYAVGVTCCVLMSVHIIAAV